MSGRQASGIPRGMIHACSSHSKLNTGHKKQKTTAIGDHFEYRMRQVSQPLFDGRARWASRLDEEEKETFKQIAEDM